MKELTYEEFSQLQDDVVDRFWKEFIRYGDDEETFEMWYYANVTYINKELNG
jgi:hypothetical protein